MFDKNYLIPSDALRIIIDSISGCSLSTEKLDIQGCLGRILSSDIFAPEDLPSFPRSTVDGYALRARDTFGAKEGSPAYISVKYEILMGEVPDFTLSNGEAAKISTGGMLPSGADAVLMLENAQAISEHLIEVTKAVAPNENVIQIGEDIKKGEMVLKKGHKLRVQDIGALAGIGISEIDVFRRPVVSLISTGDEIVSADGPLRVGQVRDINSFTLFGLVIECGGIPVKMGIFKDDYDVIRVTVERAIRDSDMVLISGGTSAGTRDMTAKIINDIANEYGGPGVLFHGVSLKPGKPTIYGLIDKKPVFGLPGHPVAIVVCFNEFIRPAIKRLSGFNQQRDFIKTINAKISKSVASVAGREDHIRVFIEEREGELYATPILGKSGLISTLVRADGIVVIPSERLGLDAGESVVVRLF